MSNSTSCRRNPSFGRTSRCFRTWRVSCCIIEAKVQKAQRGFLSRGCINLQDWWTRDSHGRNILPAELLLLNTKATKRSCFWVPGRRIRTKYRITRSLGALRAPTSSWRPFGPLDFVLRALRALRPCDPRVGDQIGC